MSLIRNGFQTFVNRDPSPAVQGDFASMNPRATALAGAGAFRSGLGNNYLSAQNLAVITNFAWAQDFYAGAQKPVGASVLGFVANELQTNIPFLAPGAGNNPTRFAVENGFPVTLFTHGDFWALPVAPLNGIVSAGDNVYARPYDGSPTNDPEAFSATGVQTAASSTMTVSAVTKGVLVPGMVITGAGVAANTSVVAQLTGTPGGAGTYQMSNTTGFASTTISSASVDTGFDWASNTVADAAFTASIAAGTGIMTVTAVGSGALRVGLNISGSGVPANLFIVSQLTGTAGSTGTYQVNSIGPAVSSTAMTGSEAKLAKISRTY